MLKKQQPRSWIRKLNTVNISILYKLTKIKIAAGTFDKLTNLPHNLYGNVKDLE